MPDHEAAREVMKSAWPSELPGPSAQALLFAQAVAWLETGYGTYWKGNGIGSNNWGAIVRGAPPCGSDGFLYTDSDGKGNVYEVCFRRYDTPKEGCADFLKVLYLQSKRQTKVWSPADVGRYRDAVYGMSATGYMAANRDAYYKGIHDRINQIAAALGEDPGEQESGGPLGGSSKSGLGTPLVLAAVGVVAGIVVLKYLAER